MKISTFKENIVSFKGCRIKSAETLWTNKSIIDHLDDKKFTLNNFSYAIPNNQFFEEIVFDLNDEISMEAERYGGIGVGINGGGARCGNIGNFQIKGIGRNPLAGDASDHWHTYGGLNLIDAIYETINAVVLGKILPIGVAKIYGILITGRKTAILPGLHEKPLDDRRGYGALLVREACVRPAHFFRSPYFKPKKGLLTDIARVCYVNQELLSQFNNSSDFISRLGQYIANYANQFAFSRVARIAHGSISPSNMCIDGRWLDLTNTTFLDGAKNIGGIVPFYSEPNAILAMLEEFIYTFSKYNGLKLNSTILMDYYFQQFQSYFVSHTSYILGVTYADIPNGIHNTHLVEISSFFSKIIGGAKEVSIARPFEINENDPVVLFIESLFTSAHSPNASIDQLCKLRVYSSKQDHYLAINSFLSLINDIYQSAGLTHISYQNFIKVTAIIAMKRALIPEYFYMGRLEGYIYHIVKSELKDKFIQVIEDSIHIASWAFNLDECPRGHNCASQIMAETVSQIIIFKTNQVTIGHDAKRECYFCFDGVNSGTFYFDTYEEVLSFFNSKGYCKVVSGYCFSKYLKRLGLVMRALDINMSFKDELYEQYW